MTSPQGRIPLKMLRATRKIKTETNSGVHSFNFLNMIINKAFLRRSDFHGIAVRNEIAATHVLKRLNRGCDSSRYFIKYSYLWLAFFQFIEKVFWNEQSFRY